MANPWFRMYAEFAHDPKVQMMPEAMQRRYIMLMCMRCGNVTETLHETEIAFHLRITDAELAETKALFIAKGFIDEGWNLLNWEKRQFASDSSTARVSKHRTKKKQECNNNETLQKQECNALDTDTDKENIKRKKSQKISIPGDFSISERVAEWAQKNKHDQLDRHFDYFVSVAKSNGYQYADWDEAFMRAVRDNWAKIEAKKPRSVAI